MPDDNNSAAAPVTNAGAPTLPTVTVPDVPVSAPVVSDAPAASDVGVSEPAPSVTVPSPVVAPTVPTNPAAAAAPTVGDEKKEPEDDTEIPMEVARKIGEAHNVLIALSSDPSVDEMAAAIGLSLYLDKLGKRATAIYSGSTPNALEFLKPEETFEPSADTLQDFVIALNKDKADHLRYKLDGDFVKVYITPYKSRISEEDLEFSYGDFNVDLVLALDVANGIDLDSALREHGRIMHDAVIINITTGNPGKLGEIEWSDKNASSVSEMIARLLYSVKSKVKIEKEEATAFLTGIVAATNRFANAKTTSETMRMSSKLIESGANQQLVSKNITPEIDNEMMSMGENLGVMGGEGRRDDDPTKLDIAHGNEEGKVDESKVVDDVVTEKESTLLDDLKAAEASLAETGAETTPEKKEEPLKIESEESEPVESAEPATESAPPVEAAPVSEPVETAPVTEPVSEPASAPESEAGMISEPGETGAGTSEGFVSAQPEKVLQPLAEMTDLSNFGEGLNKYGQMLEDALESATPAVPEPVPASVAAMPSVPSMPEVNPAVMGAPAVPTNPEINGVPEINYMPMPGDAVLPPPPTPPIADAGSVPPVAPAAPASEPTPEPLGAQPAMQDQVYNAPANDPGAFKIPGM
ncbi:hypothetical protein IKF89_01380 [Candidatus Saccharibacteria bacterium]|nr:hypothetical protein [Candidatus Saccharibacteria bacterium]